MYGEMQAVGSALTGLKTAFDLSKAFLDVKGAIDVQGKVFELQRVILAAQQDALSANEAQAKLLKRIEDLEKENSDLRNWGLQKDRYELQSVSIGAFAYVLKAENDGSEPPHWLCTSCFSSSKRSILQKVENKGSRDHLYQCPSCKSAISVHWARFPGQPQQTKQP